MKKNCFLSKGGVDIITLLLAVLYMIFTTYIIYKYVYIFILCTYTYIYIYMYIADACSLSVYIMRVLPELNQNHEK